jgi:hypothetical protein
MPDMVGPDPLGLIIPGGGPLVDPTPGGGPDDEPIFPAIELGMPAGPPAGPVAPPVEDPPLAGAAPIGAQGWAAGAVGVEDVLDEVSEEEAMVIPAGGPPTV